MTMRNRPFGYEVLWSPVRRCRPFAAPRSNWEVTQPALALLDDLVGAVEQRGRHGEAERAGGFQVDDQLELGRLLHRQIGRLGAVQDLCDVDSELPVHDRQMMILDRSD